jgi:hypothetical protein
MTRHFRITLNPYQPCRCSHLRLTHYHMFGACPCGCPEYRPTTPVQVIVK